MLSPALTQRLRPRARPSATRNGLNASSLEYLRAAGFAVLMAGAYYFGAKLGLALTLQPNPVSCLWPPNAILLGALLMSPKRFWWLILAVVFPAHLAVELRAGIPFGLVLGWFISNSCEALLGALCILPLVSGKLRFDRFRHAGVFLLFGVLLSPLITSFLDAGVVSLAGWRLDSYWHTWRIRFLSNAVAALTLVPVIVTVAEQRHSRLRADSVWRYLEIFGLITGLVAVGIVAFWRTGVTTGIVPALVYAPLPFLLWAAVRVGPIGVSTSVLLTTLLAIMGLAHGQGPFATPHPTENILSLQIFLIVMTVPLMLVAAMVQEQIQASSALRASEDRYRDVVESQTELICRFRPDTTLTFVNDAYCQYFGQSREDLLGQRFIELIPEILRAPLISRLAALVDDPRVVEHESHLVLPDGRAVWQHWTNSGFRDRSGAVVEIQGIGRDITERKQLETDLRNSEREFATLVENSPDIICRLDPGLRYIYFSPALERVTGLQPCDFLGRTPSEVALPGFDRCGFESSCRQVLATGQTAVFEFTYAGRRYRTRLIPEFAPDQSIDSLMSISEDVTERLRTNQELLEVNARLFTLQDEERRRIARELHDGAAQNLFGITINLSNLTGRLSDGPEAARLIEESQSLAEQSLQELRTLSYVLHPPLLDQSGLVSALQWYVEGFAKRSGIHVDLVVLEELGRFAPEIETALYRIVQESLTNIRRHSGSEIAIIRLLRDESKIRLEISDRGHGLNPVRTSDTWTEVAELGVGISGMRQRMLQLGGNLQIDSSERGTTIIALAPIEQRASP